MECHLRNYVGSRGSSQGMGYCKEREKRALELSSRRYILVKPSDITGVLWNSATMTEPVVGP